MHLLNTLPQRLDPGATPTFAGLIASSLTSPAGSNLTLGLGTGGTALTLTNSTLAATFAGIGKFTKPASALDGGLWVENGLPRIALNRIGITANQGLWDFLGAADGVLNFRCLPDTDSAQVIWLSVTRVGTAVTSADFRGILTTGTSTTVASILGTSLGLTENLNVGGVIKTTDTTAGSSGAGALVVQGGISAGNTGSAASYFGGNVAIADASILTFAGNPTAAYGIQAKSTISPFDFRFIGANDPANQRAFSFGYYGSNNSGSTWYEKFKVNSYTGDATFSGAVTIGNTVNSVSPTSPNRTITMVVGGVTLYIAAKTTND